MSYKLESDCDWIFSRKPNDEELAAWKSNYMPGFWKQMFTKSINTDLTVHSARYPDIRHRYDAGLKCFFRCSTRGAIREMTRVSLGI